jgi:hypothetical protein
MAVPRRAVRRSGDLAPGRTSAGIGRIGDAFVGALNARLPEPVGSTR